MRIPATVCLLSLSLFQVFGQTLPKGSIPPTESIQIPMLGHVEARSARQIRESSWSIGGETLDRDFAVYENYREFLGPLGAKGIRLQAGWAKCESIPGNYNWKWLDEIIDDALTQGVQPWLELSYGNTNYPGGGDTGLGGGLPASAEALAAWDRWARALVTRYRDRVREWEIWNEPDINRAGTAKVEAYAQLFIRTGNIIRELQPQSRIYALALAHDMNYARRFLDIIQEEGELDLIDAITVHTYPRNPDDMGHVTALREAIAKTGRPILVRQGETGAPSKFQENFALSKIEWTENTQAKWNLRRMMAHHANGVPMNLFTLSDMHYSGPNGTVRMNYKGLLGTNPDQSISHVKPSYYAAQNVFTIFDSRLERITGYAFSSSSPRRLSLSGYSDQRGRQAVAFWLSDAPPENGNVAHRMELTIPSGKFKRPLLVDLRSGIVYSVPRKLWSQSSAGALFKDLPVYDSPLVIAERDLIPLTK